MKQSTNREFALKMLKRISKNTYGNYYPKTYDDLNNLRNNSLNCRDEVCPGSHERTQKIRKLLHKRIPLDETFSEKYVEIVSELSELTKEEIMGIHKCSEREAKAWVSSHIDYNNFETLTTMDDKKYVRINPKIGFKYRSD